MENPIKNCLDLGPEVFSNCRLFDQFGSTIGFKIAGMDTYKTRYGFCITIMYYILIILAVYYFFAKH